MNILKQGGYHGTGFPHLVLKCINKVPPGVQPRSAHEQPVQEIAQYLISFLFLYPYLCFSTICLRISFLFVLHFLSPCFFSLSLSLSVSVSLFSLTSISSLLVSFLCLFRFLSPFLFSFTPSLSVSLSHFSFSSSFRLMFLFFSSSFSFKSPYSFSTVSIFTVSSTSCLLFSSLCHLSESFLHLLISFLCRLFFLSQISPMYFSSTF